MSRRYAPAGSLARGRDPIALTADDAGWRYSGLRVLRFDAGETRTIATGDTELFVLPLSAQHLTVEVDGDTFHLIGRESVFARVTDFAYVGRDTEFTIACAGAGEVAMPSARCDRRLPPRYGPAEDVAIEIRGAGPRQVDREALTVGDGDLVPVGLAARARADRAGERGAAGQRARRRREREGHEDCSQDALHGVTLTLPIIPASKWPGMRQP